ncbi:bifunctional allantoicase/(S)-ureidoglycine aminohydrolase [Pseudaminobacter sp. NGMCC 1.201702]|uniref:bifunctional allantoicase/(S)-ureidoglycine aminohydrolase n=1 Tax=Pseudaminobacter sp. NGMCC 1.201702 TaxID=3391825 RepID=UPI0039F02B62
MDRYSSLTVGGLPDQNQLISSKAVFTPAYAVVPRSVLTDIVSSCFPDWRSTRGWILARPLSGFAETFAQYLMEVEPGGGSDAPEPDPRAEAALFVINGKLTVETLGARHELRAGSFAFIPAGQSWTITNPSQSTSKFQWIRKVFEKANTLDQPPAIFTHEDEAPSMTMPGEPLWGSTRFIDPGDLRYDMHINIVWFEAGAAIPFLETHVMEHGLYILEGTGVYRLNSDWVEVEKGDFLWLRAFCPQACYARGSGRFRYLLYKDVNRHPKLW